MPRPFGEADMPIYRSKNQPPWRYSFHRPGNSQAWMPEFLREPNHIASLSPASLGAGHYHVPAGSLHVSSGEKAYISGQATFDAGNLIVRSESLKRVMKLAERVARYPSAVLISGETGTGKEMIARTIHIHSLRSNHPWVDVNCAAIPEHLVESELFGYEKGAFSGADAVKPGFFELAHQGTLFLDEIGDLDLKVQAKLLRVLDGVPYYRLGGSRKVCVDVRIVAATYRALEKCVRDGEFREDLYHRLTQFRIEIPPLRERPEDLLGIAEHILREHYPNAGFSEDAVDALLSYGWPGNVREMRNVIFRSVLQAPAKDGAFEMTAAHLCLPETIPQSEQPVPLMGNLDHVERQTIFRALEKSRGNQGEAARALGISRRTLIRKLKMYREGGAATLSRGQQQFYRAHVQLAVRIKYANEEFRGTLLNVSLGGAGIKSDRMLTSGAAVSIHLAFPGQKEAEITGRVAWSNKEGQYGIQFADVPAGLRLGLERWLRTEMKKDGWDIEQGS